MRCCNQFQVTVLTPAMVVSAAAADECLPAACASCAAAMLETLLPPLYAIASGCMNKTSKPFALLHWRLPIGAGWAACVSNHPYPAARILAINTITPATPQHTTRTCITRAYVQLCAPGKSSAWSECLRFERFPSTSLLVRRKCITMFFARYPI
jgi:hypothetical protein